MDSPRAALEPTLRAVASGPTHQREEKCSRCNAHVQLDSLVCACRLDLIQSRLALGMNISATNGDDVHARGMLRAGAKSSVAIVGCCKCAEVFTDLLGIFIINNRAQCVLRHVVVCTGCTTWCFV